VEDLKYQQNKTASERRGMPKFDLLMAIDLINGEFHDEDEEDQELNAKLKNTNSGNSMTT
jgi:hypothetical protein